MYDQKQEDIDLEALREDFPEISWSIDFFSDIPSLESSCGRYSVSYGYSCGPNGWLYPNYNTYYLFIDGDELYSGGNFYELVDLIREDFDQHKELVTAYLDTVLDEMSPVD